MFKLDVLMSPVISESNSDFALIPLPFFFLADFGVDFGVELLLLLPPRPPPPLPPRSRWDISAVAKKIK